MIKYFSRDLVIGIGIGFILASFLILFIGEKNSNTKIENEIQKPLVAELNNKEELENIPEKKEKTQTAAVTKRVVIPLGSDSERIISILLDNGIISSASEFRQALNNAGVENRLRAGTFLLPENMTNLSELVQILISDPHEE